MELSQACKIAVITLNTICFLMFLVTEPFTFLIWASCGEGSGPDSVHDRCMRMAAYLMPAPLIVSSASIGASAGLLGDGRNGAAVTVASFGPILWLVGYWYFTHH